MAEPGLKCDSQSAIFLRRFASIPYSIAYLTNKASKSEGAIVSGTGVGSDVGSGVEVGEGEGVVVGLAVGDGVGLGVGVGVGVSVGGFGFGIIIIFSAATLSLNTLPCELTLFTT